MEAQAQQDRPPYHVLARRLEHVQKLADEQHLELATQRGIIREQSHDLQKLWRENGRLRTALKRAKDPRAV